MNPLSTIFVTGATGQQGSAAVQNLLQKNFQVTALTRNPGSPKAKGLEALGVKIVHGDLNNPVSYEQHLKDVDGVFCVLIPDKGIKKEIQQGQHLADAAKRYNVKHFVYSSVIGSDLKTGIPHWESKWIIENHLRNSGIAHTILRPSSFFENLLIPQVKSGIQKGKLSTPLNRHTRQHMISTEDIGRITAEIFCNGALHKDRVYTLTSEHIDFEEIENILTSVTGKPNKHQKLPSIITRIFLGKNLHTMFKWVDKHYEMLSKEVESQKFQYEDPLSFRSWALQHFGNKQ